MHHRIRLKTSHPSSRLPVPPNVQICLTTALFRRLVDLPGTGYSALLDVTARQKSDATWNIWFSIGLIGLLLAARLLQNLTLVRQISRPLTDSLAFLRRETPHILDSLQMPEVPPQPTPSLSSCSP